MKNFTHLACTVSRNKESLAIKVATFSSASNPHPCSFACIEIRSAKKMFSLSHRRPRLLLRAAGQGKSNVRLCTTERARTRPKEREQLMFRRTRLAPRRSRVDERSYLRYLCPVAGHGAPALCRRDAQELSSMLRSEPWFRRSIARQSLTILNSSVPSEKILHWANVCLMCACRRSLAETFRSFVP